ncbi:MAG: GNAT family N-acetyltransferase [Vicinamibacterales bacterium]
MSKMIIRKARLEDARAIATIHVRAWQAAYRDIVPSAFLNELSIDQREDLWHQRLARVGNATLFLAEEDEEVLGWAGVGPSRDTDAGTTTGELYALYVSPRYWRHGVGRRLQSEGLEHLRDAGFTELTLWVLRANSNARTFYESVGFFIDVGIDKTVTIGGADLLEVRLRRQIGG